MIVELPSGFKVEVSNFHVKMYDSGTYGELFSGEELEQMLIKVAACALVAEKVLSEVPVQSEPRVLLLYMSGEIMSSVVIAPECLKEKPEEKPGDPESERSSLDKLLSSAQMSFEARQARSDGVIHWFHDPMDLVTGPGEPLQDMSCELKPAIMAVSGCTPDVAHRLAMQFAVEFASVVNSAAVTKRRMLALEGGTSLTRDGGIPKRVFETVAGLRPLEGGRLVSDFVDPAEVLSQDREPTSPNRVVPPPEQVGEGNGSVVVLTEVVAGQDGTDQTLPAPSDEPDSEFWGSDGDDGKRPGFLQRILGRADGESTYQPG